MKGLVRLFAILFSWSRNVAHSRLVILLSTVTGVIAGLASTALISLINSALAGKGPPRMFLMEEFAFLCILIPVSGFASQMLLVRLGAQAVYELRLDLSRQILAAPYDQLEKLGAHCLLAAITDDIPAVTNAITNVPLLLTQAAVMGGGLFYLGWLSWRLLIFVLGYMLVGLLSYQIPTQKSVRYFGLMREQWDALVKAIKALTEGTKELKLNRRRRHAFLIQQLEPVMDDLRRCTVQANALSLAASNWGQILFFIFIGLVLFLAPFAFSVDRQTLTGYTLTVLFLIAPLMIILSMSQVFARAHVAAEKIKTLGLSLAGHPLEKMRESDKPLNSWESLDLIGVTHVYDQEAGTDDFVLGPLDLTFLPGELVFITGGNGSGKTTLAKLLMGLYEPSAGEIRFNHEHVTGEWRDEYRQHFSVVFADFYLFDRLFGVDGTDLETKCDEYLRRLHLDAKVQIIDDKLSTTDLSQGQRRRLALLSAYLEDRPIYIFDEWASDQDPMFKQIFYYQILPELRARGKTLIVITHDDRYYDVADRLIKLERGKLEYDRRLALNSPVRGSVPAAG